MTSKLPCLRRLALAVPIGVLAASAAAQVVEPVERITATTVAGRNTVGESVKVEVIRWSTDAERAQLVPLLTGKPTKEADAVQKAASVGYLWTSAPVGYAVRYAERQKLPDGGDRIVLVVDRRLSAWEGKPFEAATPPKAPEAKPEEEKPETPPPAEGQRGRGRGAPPPPPPPPDKPVDLSPFTVVELRLSGAMPAGKVAPATKIVANADGKGITLGDYAAATVQLKSIKRTSKPEAPAKKS